MTPAMKALIVPAPAKVNLFLHVTGRRADGYHTLESLFALIDFADFVSLEVRDDGVVERIGDVEGVAFRRGSGDPRGVRAQGGQRDAAWRRG